MPGGAGRRALALTFGVALSVGCAHAGTGQVIGAPRGNGWLVVPNVKMVAQQNDADCGPAALATALTRWGRAPSPDAWQSRAGENRTKDGFSAGTLRDEARRAGFQSFVVDGTFDDLTAEVDAGHPVILGLVRLEHDVRIPHFVVVVGHDTGARRWLVADPALGVQSVSRDALETQWSRAGWVTLVLALNTGAPPARATASPS